MKLKSIPSIVICGVFLFWSVGSLANATGAQSLASDNGSFQLGGDSNIYYPVYFSDGDWDKGMFILNIHRPSVHEDGIWYGSMLLQIRSHSSNWGHMSDFLENDLYVKTSIGGASNVADVKRTVHDKTGVIVWLKGGLTYYYNSNHSVPTVLNTSQSDGRIVLTIYQNQEIEFYEPRSDINPELEQAGKTLGGNIKVDGNVAIGTTVGSHKLTVNGSIRAEQIVTDQGFKSSAFSVSDAGNVGIGTTAAAYRLAVNGTIRAKEVIVDTGWADYVFADDYELQPLEEVEAHIKKNKHLPGIPSAKEIVDKGASIGEIQTLLLSKIEELTLHQIELNKKVEIQSARIRKLEAENIKLRVNDKMGNQK